MKIKKFLIAKGNSTLLIWDCPKEKRLEISKKYLNKVEQVGFITEEKGIPKLVMMGNELCINGTLALASTFDKKGILYTSGFGKSVEYENVDGKTCIKLPLFFKRRDNLILFEGLGYKCIDKDIKVSKKQMAKLAEKYQLPAFGIVIYKNNKIKPIIYVKDTKSLVEETACGSGSIAVSIITGIEEIVQPTGETISVSKRNGVFEVCARVKEKIFGKLN